MDNVTVEAVIERTKNAYFLKHYGLTGWRVAIKWLLSQGWTETETVEIMCSKIPRWAADHYEEDYHRHGRYPGKWIAQYVTNNPEVVRDCLRGTVPGWR